MRILITGGSGFIGTNLLEYLTAHTHHVCNFDIVAPRNIKHHSNWHQGDLLDVDELRSLLLKFSPEIIFHMAARTDLDGKTVDDYSINTVGVKNLICASRGIASLRRIIFASSRLVCKIDYNPKDEFDYYPDTPYGQSKVNGEKIVRNYLAGMPCEALIVRPTSIWGPWFEVPYKNFFLTIANERYVHPPIGSIFKSFGFVGNTVYQLERLMEASSDLIANKTFYLADYPPIDLKVYADSIQNKIGVSKIKTIPLPLIKGAAIFGDILKFLGWRNAPLTSFRLKNLLTTMVYDTDSLKSIVGSLPYSMEQGVNETVDWLRSQGEIQ